MQESFCPSDAPGSPARRRRTPGLCWVDAGRKKERNRRYQGSEATAVQLIIQGSPHPGTFLSNQVWEEGLFIYIEMFGVF